MKINSSYQTELRAVAVCQGRQTETLRNYLSDGQIVTKEVKSYRLVNEITKKIRCQVIASTL